MVCKHNIISQNNLNYVNTIITNKNVQEKEMRQNPIKKKLQSQNGNQRFLILI